MAVNKVEYYGKVLLDLTEDTVTEDTLHKGVVAHDKTGAKVTGTFTLDNELSTQDSLIAQIKSALNGKALPDGGSSMTPEELSIFDPTQETILTRTTATYKTIVLTKTMIAYVNTGKYAGYLGCKFDAVVGHTYRISWEKISTSDDFVFYYESDTILDKADDHYGTRLYPKDNPFTFTATKPYVYIWAAHPTVPSNSLVLVTGLMVHDVTGV